MSYKSTTASSYSKMLALKKHRLIWSNHDDEANKRRSIRKSMLVPDIGVRWQMVVSQRSSCGLWQGQRRDFCMRHTGCRIIPNRQARHKSRRGEIYTEIVVENGRESKRAWKHFNHVLYFKMSTINPRIVISSKSIDNNRFVLEFSQLKTHLFL